MSKNPTPQTRSPSPVNLIRELSPASTISVRRLRSAVWVAVAALLVIIILTLCAPLLPIRDPVAIDVTNILQPPSATYWFGTDDLGRDVFARVMYGGRPPLGIATASVILGAIIGVILGMVAGYCSGFTDQFLGRIADIQMSIPGIVLALLLLAVYGTGPVMLTIAIAIESWPLYFRVVRGQALSVRRAGFIEAARLASVGPVKILFRHILPVTYSLLMVAMAINFTGAVLAESALSFLGVGVAPPTPDWGVMIAEGQSYLDTAWWVSLIPGVFLVIVLLAFQTIADALSERYSLKDTILSGETPNVTRDR